MSSNIREGLDNILIEHNANLLRINKGCPFIEDNGKRYRNITDLRRETTTQIITLLKKQTKLLPKREFYTDDLGEAGKNGYELALKDVGKFLCS